MWLSIKDKRKQMSNEFVTLNPSLTYSIAFLPNLFSIFGS